MTWKENERKAFEWFKANYDPNAIYQGGSDSTVPDIISPVYGNIEIKGPKAQCGQFTETTIDNSKFNQYIANKTNNNEEVTKEDANMWCRNFYKEKNSNYFIATDKKYNYHFMTRDEYFDTHTCKLTIRDKLSGAGDLSKIYYDQIPKEWNYQIQNRKAYVLDKTLWDEVSFFTDKKGQLFRMSPTSGCFGKIRKLSNTKNKTWIFEVQ